MAADVTRPVTAQVPVTLTGEAPGVARSGGYISQQVFDIQVSALPLEMPGQIELDISVLTEPNSVLRTGDIVLPAGVTLLTDPEEMVARIEVPRVSIGGDAEDQEGESPGEEAG
jgi:large subunit ribosomal protein L25